MKSLLLIFSLLISTLTYAQTLNVATDTWEGYTDRNGTGYYLELLNAIFPSPEYQLKILHMPYARSVEALRVGQADIVLGTYVGDIDDAAIYSHSIVEEDIVDAIVSPALAKAWKGKESLEGQSVVAKIGYEFDTALDVKMKYSENAHVLSMLKMLAQKRVDAVLDYEAGVRPLWAEAGLTDEFKIKKGVIRATTHFAFVNDIHGKALMDKFDERFKALYLDGVVQDLYVKHVGNDSGLPKQY